MGDGCGAMPLHIAAACKNVDVARVLLENGANVNARMQAGVTALHIAADNWYDNIQRLLILVLSVTLSFQ